MRQDYLWRRYLDQFIARSGDIFDPSQWHTQDFAHVYAHFVFVRVLWGKAKCQESVPLRFVVTSTSSYATASN